MFELDIYVCHILPVEGFIVVHEHSCMSM